MLSDNHNYGTVPEDKLKKEQKNGREVNRGLKEKRWTHKLKVKLFLFQDLVSSMTKWRRLSSHLPNFGPPLWSPAFYIQRSNTTIQSWYFTTVLISWLISFQRLFLSPLNQVSSPLPRYSVTGDIHPHDVRRVLHEAESGVGKHTTKAEATQTSHNPTESNRHSIIWSLALLCCFLCKMIWAYLQNKLELFCII